ncbi:hypothetical protein GQF61_04755 [Sphingobacterium sp. DK4209]|uniref:Uncharacterized protein n=1 Tax=Sphingobacterium zhuxiongii TaxID=2662364 RepID=A0A5Q0QAC2_9SPHI|nr:MULTISPECIES: DUF6157 family protein [unclassified Sphingobacterium]MVZ65152.1 hypothetical protein [Sphingobacterium sp. DK4209]QGA26099.1 hypothetical protein GFH32_07085 [Sphingobacterium sp. dk4302]
MHSTNYYNSLITVAEDCKVSHGTIPKESPEKLTVANYHFQLINQNPLALESDDIIFNTHVLRKDITTSEIAAERSTFFSKGQACLRTSPLTKTYGWGIYFDEKGRVKLVDSASEEYFQLIEDKTIKKIPAMRSSKK